MPANFWMAICLAAGVSACSRRPRRPTFTVRDSAGVRIVENGGALWTATQAWRLSAEPSVTIGAVEGLPAEEITRVSGALRLADGRLVVANAYRPPELRVYDPVGRHLRSMGRAGGGPGEFSAIHRLFLAPPDTLIAYDADRARHTHFRVDGELLGVVPFRWEGDVLARVVWGRFSDGTYLTRPNSVVPSDASRGRGRALTAWTRVRPDGSLVDTIARIRDPEYEIGGPGGDVVRLLLFSSWPAVLAHRGSLYVGVADEFRIDAYGLSGRLRRSIRRSYDRRPVTDADLRALEERELEAATSPAARERIRRRHRSVPHAEWMPAHGTRLLVDAEGDLWVEEFAAPTDPERAWSVFDPGGRFLGRVAVPEPLRICDVGRDYVLGVWTDALGVESVREYELLKPAE
ncbi:MAG: hypothetical protein ACE5HP_10350 [Gemmatimonadota bacterium]